MKRADLLLMNVDAFSHLVLCRFLSTVDQCRTDLLDLIDGKRVLNSVRNNDERHAGI